MYMDRSVYAQTARFDNHARALSEDELRKIAPGIFATTAHHSRSDRFSPIATIDVLRGLEREGFSVVAAKQAIVRTDDRKDFTKHVVRLRRLADGLKYNVGDTVFEILMKNANDGSSVYDFLAGGFRVCCLNSLVLQTKLTESLKVRHSGNVVDKVIEGTYRVLDSAEEAMKAPQDWPRIKLSRDEQQIFAEAAHEVRFADADGKVETPIKPAQLLIARRTGDQQNDLWSTFNVVQENAVKGGLSAMGYDANNRPRRTTSREVKGIDQDLKLNRALFTLASKLAELKQAA